MIYLAYAILIGGFILFFIGLLPKKSEVLSIFGEQIKDKTNSAFTPILGPFAPFNEKILKFLRLKEPLDNSIALVKWKITPAEFLSLKELAAVLIPLIVFFTFDEKPIAWIIVAVIVSFIVPDFILRSKVNKVKYSIVRVLPETVDLLALCVGAGLDFMAAVRWITTKVQINPLIAELAVVLKEINVGKSRLEALRDMSRRLNIPDITSFVRTLVQADRMGTPVEEAFTILSEDTRIRRFYRGERIAMKAPIKMLVPLIFCILPVILIIVAGPIVINFMTEGIFGLGK